jgi:dTDP-4-amino-4,6-dideoxygalactose transaminase
VLYERLKRLRSHGITRQASAFRNGAEAVDPDGEPFPWYYELQELGYNYRASDIHCALAFSQLSKLDRFVAKRRTLAEIYDRKLTGLAPVVLPPKRVSGCNPAWHLYAARVDFARLGMPREVLMRRLQAKGVGTQVHYVPVHWQPYYTEISGQRQLPGAAAYYRQTLSLPLFPAMGEQDVARVIEALAACMGQGGRSP